MWCLGLPPTTRERARVQQSSVSAVRIVARSLNSISKRRGYVSSMSDDLRIVACNAESVLSGLADQLQNGPTLRIVHRFWHPGTQCLAGEEVWSIALLHRGKELCLPLSLALRLVLNHLAETRHVPQSATQIAAGMRRSPFYVKH